MRDMECLRKISDTHNLWVVFNPWKQEDQETRIDHCSSTKQVDLNWRLHCEIHATCTDIRYRELCA